MKFVMLGNLHAEHSTENDLLWTLRDMDHDVLPLQENTARNVDILEACRFHQPDVFLAIHTHGWDVEDRVPLLEALRRNGVITASFHLDKYRGLDREPMVGKHWFFKTDYFFGVEGAQSAWYRERGVNHVFIRPGVKKASCYLAPYNPEYECDVCFVGAYGYHKEWTYRQKLIDWLRSSYGERFKKFGGPEPTLRGHALNELYASAKVVVGDSLCLGFQESPGYYFSDRPYETLGRGGCLIMPYIKGLDDEFKDGVHIRYYPFNDFGALARVIRELLASKERRDLMRFRAHEFVRDHATYHNRLAQLVGILESEIKLRRMQQ